MTIPPSRRGPRLTFLGAARSITGSQHLLETKDLRILLDCGLTVGRRHEGDERNRIFAFDPASITGVVVTHAHLDHGGNVPNLVAQGFRGPIWCTAATRDLLALMWADLLRARHRNANDLSPAVQSYVSDHLGNDLLRRTLDQVEVLSEEHDHPVARGVSIRLLTAGHLLGSAMALVTVDCHSQPVRVLYTGDLGRTDLPFLPPARPFPEADVVICESTYGGRRHPRWSDLEKRLADVAQRTWTRGGKLLIPAFSMGRSQMAVHFLRQAMLRRTVDSLPIHVDSPLAADATDVHRKHDRLLLPEVRETLAGASDDVVRHVRCAEESKLLQCLAGPAVVVASGGMCETGRITGHLEQSLDDPRNTVLLVSFQAPGSVGSKLLQRGPAVKIRGRSFRKWADVVELEGLSGHADHEDLLAFFRPLLARQPIIRLVHGDWERSEILRDHLFNEGFDDVDVPAEGETLDLEPIVSTPAADGVR